MKIVFVCLGNFCRSPAAEGIAKEYIKNKKLNIKVDSCGTSGWHVGDAPDFRMRKVAKDNKINIDNLKGRQISIYTDVDWDYYIVMDESNKKDLMKMGFNENKIKKLGEFGENNQDVPDPYNYSDLKGFEEVFAMIKKCVINLINSKI